MLLGPSACAGPKVKLNTNVWELRVNGIKTDLRHRHKASEERQLIQRHPVGEFGQRFVKVPRFHRFPSAQGLSTTDTKFSECMLFATTRFTSESVPRFLNSFCMALSGAKP